MSRELTEKKRRNIRGDKAVVKQETIQESYQDPRTPYTGNTQAVFTEVDGNGGFTYKLQELDDFNLPEWVGGWLWKDDFLNNRTHERLNVS